jgi:hypothetical protein
MSNYKGEDREEKHYTPSELLDEMFSLEKRFVDFDITEYLENSAGSGNIIDRFKKPYIAFDINNETGRQDIKECDYIKEKIDYKEGRVCIMNPPFAKGLKFLYKALKESDYVISILSQNSLLNIDYSKVWVDEIQLYRNYNFGSCKVSIIIVACRNKTPNDKYEYDI